MTVLLVCGLCSLRWEPFDDTCIYPLLSNSLIISFGVIGILRSSFPYHSYIITRVNTYVNGFIKKKLKTLETYYDKTIFELANNFNKK